MPQEVMERRAQEPTTQKGFTEAEEGVHQTLIQALTDDSRVFG